MSRHGTTSIILAVFVLTTLSGCLGSEDEGPKGPTTVSETAKGTDITEFSFEPVKMSPTATITKASEERKAGLLCDHDVQCTTRTVYQFNWSIENLPDLSTSDGGVGEVFYQLWLGEGEGEDISWFYQDPVPGKDGKIVGSTDWKATYDDYTHFRVTIETKQDVENEIVIFEANELETGATATPAFTKPFAGAFGTASLEPGVKKGEVNLTATAISLPQIPGGYDAFLLTGETTYLGRLKVDPESGGLSVTVPVAETKIANEWTVFITYEPSSQNEDPSGLRVLTARFAS